MEQGNFGYFLQLLSYSKLLYNRLTAKLNHTHTVGDIRQFIES